MLNINDSFSHAQGFEEHALVERPPYLDEPVLETPMLPATKTEKCRNILHQAYAKYFENIEKELAENFS